MNTTVSLIIEIKEPSQAVCGAGGVASQTRRINANHRAVASLLGFQRSCYFQRLCLEKGYR